MVDEVSRDQGINKKPFDCDYYYTSIALAKPMVSSYGLWAMSMVSATTTSTTTATSTTAKRAKLFICAEASMFQTHILAHILAHIRTHSKHTIVYCLSAIAFALS